MPALYKGRPHLTAVPQETSSIGDTIDRLHLRAAGERLRRDTMEAATIAAVSNPKAASHFAKALTHLNEALEELK